MKKLLARMHPFSRGEDGSVIIEAVFVLPALFWAAFSLFAYWDVNRNINTVQKASYTVADTISRRIEPINLAYLTGLRDMMNFLIDRDQTAQLRVTSITYSKAELKFKVQWSKSPGAALPELTTDTLQAVKTSIPAMADGDTVILVETRVEFTPVFDVGLTADSIEEFIITRPRMAPKVCFVAC